MASATPRTRTTTSKEIREPAMTRLRMSRPTVSVPNQWAGPGGWSAWSRSWAVTEYGATTSAKTARTSTTRSNAMPTIAPKLPRTRRVERYHACAEKAARVMPTDVRVAKRPVITSVPDPWIEHEIADVRGEVQGDVEDRAEQRNRHDRVEVQCRDRVHRPGSDARPREDGLDRKSTRLNSSHSQISYAVFCLK